MSGNRMDCFFKCFIPWAVFVSLFILPGCSKPHLTEEYGRSYDAMFYAQVLNHNAPMDRNPVDGCSGVAAESIYAQYLRSFSEKSFAEQLGEMVMGRGRNGERRR